MAGKSFILAAGVILALAYVARAQQTATCQLMVNSALEPAEREPVAGTLILSQEIVDGVVTISGDVTGFDITDADTLHGFHVHETSDLSDGCDSTGGHFNPAGSDHGAPNAAVRHVGDLGNIMEDANGAVAVNIMDDVINFSGPNNILDRAIVIHAWEDDLGLTNHTDSPTTGNAGPRLACCAITLD